MSADPSGHRVPIRGEFIVWMLVSLASRTPVAMAPLALVFLSRHGAGGYASGAVLASAYVLGEVAGAPLLGARLRAARIRRQLAAGLAVGACAFVALPFARFAPLPVLIGLAFLAGAAPAACPGGARVLLTRMVKDTAVPRALSVEATLTQIIWAASPGLVVLLALEADAGAPLLLGGALAATASLLLLRLPEHPAAGPAGRSGTAAGRVLLSAWPVYLTSAAAMTMLATAELVLPALLEDRQVAVGWAGPLLAGFALAGAAGALCYGLRSWRGSARTQSLILLTVTAGCVGLIAVLPGLPGIAAGLLLAGLFQSGVMITRSLSLRERLPEHAHAGAYSVMYAAGGIGYGLTAVLSAVVLDAASPAAAVAGGAAVALVATAVSAIAERGVPKHMPGSRPRSAPSDQCAETRP
ncbi:MFS transporter [Streptomyces sp. BH055]|uniref:MFS transporter n=1 Tax=Streptomyces sp. BH055 TaxID=3401173 RepID=UPI003BB5C732